MNNYKVQTDNHSKAVGTVKKYNGRKASGCVLKEQRWWVSEMSSRDGNGLITIGRQFVCIGWDFSRAWENLARCPCDGTND